MVAVTTNSANQVITQYNVQTGDASNGLNQVTPGASGTVLTSNGASSQPTFQAVSSASPTTTVSLYDDFIGSAQVTPELNGQLSWYNPGASLTASNFVTGSVSASTAHPGVIGSGNILTSFPISLIFLGDSTVSWPLGGGALTVDWVFKINTASNSTNRYTLRFGMGSTSTNSDQANGVYFEYSDNLNSGNWNYKSANASTRTTSNSSTAVTTGWHHGTVSINAAATSISFTMDGVSLGTAISTNIPTAAIMPFFELLWSVGNLAANAVAVDLFYANQTLTNTR